MLTFHIDSDFYGNSRRLIRGSEGFKGYIYPDTDQYRPKGSDQRGQHRIEI